MQPFAFAAGPRGWTLYVLANINNQIYHQSFILHFALSELVAAADSHIEVFASMSTSTAVDANGVCLLLGDLVLRRTKRLYNVRQVMLPLIDYHTLQD